MELYLEKHSDTLQTDSSRAHLSLSPYSASKLPSAQVIFPIYLKLGVSGTEQVCSCTFTCFILSEFIAWSNFNTRCSTSAVTFLKPWFVFHPACCSYLTEPFSTMCFYREELDANLNFSFEFFQPPALSHLLPFCIIITPLMKCSQTIPLAEFLTADLADLPPHIISFLVTCNPLSLSISVSLRQTENSCAFSLPYPTLSAISEFQESHLIT